MPPCLSKGTGICDELFRSGQKRSKTDDWCGYCCCIHCIGSQPGLDCNQRTGCKMWNRNCAFSFTKGSKGSSLTRSGPRCPLRCIVNCSILLQIVNQLLPVLLLLRLLLVRPSGLQGFETIVKILSINLTCYASAGHRGPARKGRNWISVPGGGECRTW